MRGMQTVVHHFTEQTVALPEVQCANHSRVLLNGGARKWALKGCVTETPNASIIVFKGVHSSPFSRSCAVAAASGDRAFLAETLGVQSSSQTAKLKLRIAEFVALVVCRRMCRTLRADAILCGLFRYLDCVLPCGLFAV